MKEAKKTVRILVIKPSSLGDIIQMLQVIEGGYYAAQNQGIRWEIHWVVRDCFADFLRLSPIVSKLLLFKRSSGLYAFCRLIQEIRSEFYDWVVDGQGLLRSGLMTGFARANYKIGRRDAREGSRFFYQQTYVPKKPRPHALERLQALLTPFGVNSGPARPLSLRLPSWPFNFDERSILLFPNSRGPKKEWPFFRELTTLLLKKTPYTCVWVGQKTIGEGLNHPRFVNLIGKTSLSDLPLLIQSARCVVANDSAPIHLAAALKRPLVGIYGPTDGIIYGPYPTKEHCVLQAPGGKLTQLTPQMAENAVMQQLQ